MAPRCPVCRARFRESVECRRCGADLEPLMLLLAGAHLFRMSVHRPPQPEREPPPSAAPSRPARLRRSLELAARKRAPGGAFRRPRGGECAAVPVVA